jgi:uncharacterized protein (DUF58 family)
MIMKTTRLTDLLLALAALFIALGALLDAWFYAGAGFALALYIVWRFLAFRAAIAALNLDVRRNADKAVVRRGGTVTIDVAVSSATPVEGRFTDVLPRGAELVEGTNSADLALAAGQTATWGYTLLMASRQSAQVQRATFTMNNGLFTHTLELGAAASVVQQAPYAVSVEGGAGGPGAAPGGPGGAPGGQGAAPGGPGGALGVTSVSVQSLYRTRRIGSGPDLSHIRPFAEGDPLKRIHWKASARLNQLMTKEFLAEVDEATGAGASVSIIIDQGGTMARGPPGATELDFAVNVASHLVKSAIARGNRIGLITYDDQGVVTSLPADLSLPHASSVVRSLNEIEPGIPLRPPRAKLDVTGADVVRVKRHFAATADDESDGDIRHFRHVVSYMYTRGEGYLYSLKRAPAFRAIAASLKRAQGQSTIVIVSDLEKDFSPLTEGVRLATSRGARVHVVALFSKIFEQFAEPLLSLEDVYAAYDAHLRRIRKLEQIHNVTVIEANTAETLQPALQEAWIA